MAGEFAIPTVLQAYVGAHQALPGNTQQLLAFGNNNAYPLSFAEARQIFNEIASQSLTVRHVQDTALAMERGTDSKGYPVVEADVQNEKEIQSALAEEEGDSFHSTTLAMERGADSKGYPLVKAGVQNEKEIQSVLAEEEEGDLFHSTLGLLTSGIPGALGVQQSAYASELVEIDSFPRSASLRDAIAQIALMESLEASPELLRGRTGSIEKALLEMVEKEAEESQGRENWPTCFSCGVRFHPDNTKFLDPKYECPHKHCGRLECREALFCKWLDMRKEVTDMDDALN